MYTNGTAAYRIKLKTSFYISPASPQYVCILLPVHSKNYHGLNADSINQLVYKHQLLYIRKLLTLAC